MGDNPTVTLCLAATAGVILVIVSRRIRIPSIVLLLIGGVGLGPEGLGLIDPASLEGGLEIVVALAVALILFEGGLTLDLEGYRQSPRVIKRLLTVGPLLTWMGTAATVVLVFGLEPGMALMAGSLVIVTGPTVVLPLLRRLAVRERLHHVLYWEAVLVDVVGVFVAVLCYEWLGHDSTTPLAQPLGRFALRLLVGGLLGAFAGLTIATALTRRWVSAEHVNIFVLSGALLTYGVAHLVVSESGILAVVVAGLTVGLKHPPQLKHVRQFKLQLTELGVGVVFILLSAKLDLTHFSDSRLLILLLVVALVLRPVVVWLSTWRQQFELREKLFLSWIAPRGIVAAALASLFAFRLEDLGHADAVYLETFTYAVIAATVTIQGLSAPLVMRLLGLQRTERRTWVLIGDRTLVRVFGRGLRRAGAKVYECADDATSLKDADPYDPEIADAAAVLCLHTSLLKNAWAAYEWTSRLGDTPCFRWSAAPDDNDSSRDKIDRIEGTPVWSTTMNAAEVARGVDLGQLAIDVVDADDPTEHGRFGDAIQILFWVENGRAFIVPDPRKPGPAKGDLAVVLRRRIAGLNELIVHVDVIDTPAPSLRTVIRRMAERATDVQAEIDVRAIVEGIMERQRSSPVGVGRGVAIPHTFQVGLERSICLVANVVGGVADSTGADGEPIRLVFLLVSPLGNSRQHLASLANLARLTQDRDYVDLMMRQRVPERLAQLIVERA